MVKCAKGRHVPRFATVPRHVWIITSSHDIDAPGVPAFVSLLGQKVSVTVLFDSGTEGGGKVEAAIKANKIAGKRVFFVGSVLEQKHSDIENLLTVGDYLGLYNQAFGG